ncbi:hypothetical protein [Pseudodesulfovibrio senegalensis]|uniref:Uncharacterized protein n=1 Tax=Pseudodesulfovibrio senegalensis TaxID=1721087 RepID=A0A6N6N4B4_9BACT|nr:hypothetical protein [Pseudodesulfovibrio senegalensis]KAB1443070.1 hypothetical protein F8A88_02055 [Pseudodesulfovibrio senegalensis]
MDIKDEKLTATNARRHAHGDNVNELAVMSMKLKDRFVIKCDDGVTRERLLMQCMGCGEYHMTERVVGERWEPRYYACDNGCNSIHWTPEKKRNPYWAIACLSHLISIIAPEMDDNEIERLTGAVSELANTIRDPHNPHNLWGEIIWGVEDDIFTVEKRIGKTPRVIAAYNLLAHVAEYSPWDNVKETDLDRAVATLRNMHGDIRYKNHKRKHPNALPMPPIDHEAILAKATSLRDVTAPPVSALHALDLQ